MKLFKLGIIAMTLLLLSLNTLAQQIKGSISSFEILPEYLINGALKINSTGTTTFKFKVQFVKVQTGNNTFAFTPAFLKLSTPNSTGGSVDLSDEKATYLGEFESGKFFLTKEYTVTVNRSNFTQGRNVYLHYRREGQNLFNAYSKSYAVVFVATGGSTNPPGPQTPKWYDIPSPYTNAEPLNRLRKLSGVTAGNHTLASNNEGKGLVISNIWIYEGTLGHVKTIQEQDMVPLYRFIKQDINDHYFKLTSTPPNGYVSEGIQGYVYQSPGPGRRAVYQFYKTSGGLDHLYGTNPNEVAGLSGWAAEGIAFYILD